MVDAGVAEGDYTNFFSVGDGVDVHVRTAELDKATYPARGVGGWSEEVASLEDRGILGDLRNRGEEMGRCWCFGLGRWCAVRGRLNIGGSEDVRFKEWRLIVSNQRD